MQPAFLLDSGFPFSVSIGLDAELLQTDGGRRPRNRCTCVRIRCLSMLFLGPQENVKGSVAAMDTKRIVFTLRYRASPGWYPRSYPDAPPSEGHWQHGLRRR